ncbi:MAG: bifunctional demethylmenaquinone methyltransferase/2-methoxy-6-polyprenyl-1,4-benzoquinol methylase UbiE [Nitrospinae bacterium]|nr:bifunctional demethylmenaquinone methyltransferase/2-methoxy-6-polyprenyl-1,4-benzoquinol methylase UbiE [Nitrospinota bacterium]
MTIKKDPSKISGMFSAIAPRYDLLNRLLSGGLDRRWRKTAIDQLPVKDGVFLDVATGTCDVALEQEGRGAKARIIGIDFSHEMLKAGRKKTVGRQIHLGRADALRLPFRDAVFDGLTCAYGIRNFASLADGLKEMLRTLKPGGAVSILEFTTPSNPVVKFFYLFYFSRILPLVGRIVSGHPDAYTYLPMSVMNFPDRKKLAEIFTECGFTGVKIRPLTFGITDLITARKPG